MRIIKYFAALCFISMLASCQNDASTKINEADSKNSESNNPKERPIEKTENKKQKPFEAEENVASQNPAEGELKRPETLYESIDIEHYDFGNSPFLTENAKEDLANTAYIKIDTAIYPNPHDRQLKDSMLYFYYDDQSEISLMIRGKENRIVYAAMVSNILPLKNNVAMGMNKESFWSSFPKMDKVHRDFNILRVTNEDKMIWVGLQFQDDVLKILEYNGSNL